MFERSPGSHLFDDEGRRYTLGALLAEGGEGSIHDVVGLAATVVKVLHVAGRSRGGQLVRESARKIGHMLAHPPQAPAGLAGADGHPYWAWPERCLRAADGSFAGYLMPKLAGVKGEEFHLFGSGYAWDARMAAARDVASLVVATHESGYVIGDLNPRNLFFTPLDAGPGSGAGAGAGSGAGSGADTVGRHRVVPSLIDTDSFQVDDPAGGSVPLFECRVQNPEYSAPELINGTTRVRTQQQDAFALAIVVFQALALGVHPFSGVARRSPIREIRSNIARRQNLLLSRELVPPKGMIDLAVLPPTIRACFERTFGAGHLVTGSRVDAAEWTDVLSRTIDAELIYCDRVPYHVYGRHQRACPWCGYARSLGADPFVAPPAAGARRRRVVPPKVIQTREGVDRGAVGRRPQALPTASARMGPGAPDDTIFGTVPPGLRSGGVPTGGAAADRPSSGGTTPRPAPADDDTIFGQVPAGLGSEAAGAAGPGPAPRPAAAPAAPSPSAPPAGSAPSAPPAAAGAAPAVPAPPVQQAPGGAGVPGAQPAASPRVPLVKPWIVVTLLMAVVVAVFWIGLGGQGRQAVAARVQSWFGGLGSAVRDGPVEVPIFTPGGSQGSHSLTIELCVDRAPPYACSGETLPLRGIDVAILGSRGVERRAATTLEGMRVFYARDLPADRYTINLIDTTGERLLERYVWCDGVGPGGATLGSPFGVRLDRDRTIALVLCAR